MIVGFIEIAVLAVFLLLALAALGGILLAVFVKRLDKPLRRRGDGKK